jgi:hypothetical protein
MRSLLAKVASTPCVKSKRPAIGEIERAGAQGREGDVVPDDEVMRRARAAMLVTLRTG